MSGGPAVQSDQRLVVDDVGMVGGAVARDVETLAEIRPGVAVDRRMPHGLPAERQIADIVLPIFSASFRSVGRAKKRAACANTCSRPVPARSRDWRRRETRYPRRCAPPRGRVARRPRLPARRARYRGPVCGPRSDPTRAPLRPHRSPRFLPLGPCRAEAMLGARSSSWAAAQAACASARAASSSSSICSRRVDAGGLHARAFLGLRDIGRHGDADLRVQHDPDRMQADGLDRPVEHDLLLSTVKPPAVTASAMSRTATEP